MEQGMAAAGLVLLVFGLVQSAAGLNDWWIARSSQSWLKDHDLAQAKSLVLQGSVCLTAGGVSLWIVSATL